MRRKLFYILILLCIGAWVHHVYLRVGKAEMTDAVRAQAKQNFVALANGTTAYQITRGEYGAVVLVHGFSVPSVIWDNTFEILSAQDFTVLRYDLFGRGYSDRPDVKYDSTLFVEQLKELIDKLLPKQKIVLCGLSMGGAISVAFAAKYPERVEKLILIDPAGFPMPTPFVARLLKIPGIGTYLGRLFAQRAMQKGLPENFTAGVPPRIESEALKQIAYSGYADAIVSTVRHMDMTGMESTYRQWGRQNIPTLLLWGKKDKIIPFQNAALIQRAIPHVKLVAFETAGHIPTVDAKREAHRAILQFLAAE